MLVELKGDQGGFGQTPPLVKDGGWSKIRIK